MNVIIEKLNKIDNFIYVINYNYYLLSFNNIGNITNRQTWLNGKEKENENIIKIDDMIFEQPMMYDYYINVPKNCVINHSSISKIQYYIDITEFKKIELEDFKEGYTHVFKKLYKNKTDLDDEIDIKTILERINIYEGYERDDDYKRINLCKYLNTVYVNDFENKFINYILSYYDIQLFNSKTETEIKTRDDIIYNSSDRYCKYKNYIIIKTKYSINELDNIFSDSSLEFMYYSDKYYKSVINY